MRKLRKMFGAYRWYALGACGLCALLLLISTGYTRGPVVETVTTDSTTRPVAVPTASPVYYTAQLPSRDEDIEAAGDRIAEASVYLKKKQSTQALRALTQARKATHRALDTRTRNGKQRTGLLLTLQELEAVERSIQHGAYDDAHRQLIHLDQSLDQLIY